VFEEIKEHVKAHIDETGNSDVTEIVLPIFKDCIEKYAVCDEVHLGIISYLYSITGRGKSAEYLIYDYLRDREKGLGYTAKLFSEQSSFTVRGDWP
jgi:hypothetical protein